MGTMKTIWWALTIVSAAMLPAAHAEVSGPLTRELAGTELTYHYDGGRKYRVRFAADTISWLRLDVPGRTWENGTPYIARKISDTLYFVNWHRPERTEYITILFDFDKRVMYTSALLEGKDRHFESARIVELKRQGR
jgi:hypothetical protein